MWQVRAVNRDQPRDAAHKEEDCEYKRKGESAKGRTGNHLEAGPKVADGTEYIPKGPYFRMANQVHHVEDAARNKQTSNKEDGNNCDGQGIAQRHGAEDDQGYAEGQ